jgi:hypothetical protein
MLATLLLCTASCTPPPATRALQDGYPRRAPFEAVRWSAGATHCRLDGAWFLLDGIDDVSSVELLAFCEETWPGQARKRFGEDLVEALTRMGRAPGDTVVLALRTLDGAALEPRAARMTEENRASVRDVLSGRAPEDVARLVLGRERAPELPPELVALSVLVAGRSEGSVAKDKALDDLVHLEQRLAAEYSYLRLRGVDYRAALDAVALGVERAPGDRLELRTFQLALLRLMALFGDGHSGVGGLGGVARAGYAPFLLADTAGGVAAFRPDRLEFQEPRHPFILRIGPFTIDEWVARAQVWAAHGSPQWRRRQALRNLRYLAHLYAAEGRELPDRVPVTFADHAGEQVVREVAIDRHDVPRYGSWPRGTTRLLEGGVGYLRIPSMSAGGRFVTGLRASMERFADTHGLVIDVRGNGGGRRDALRALLPYFLDADAPPRVVNVARLRTAAPSATPDLLADRGLYPLQWEGWSDAAREVLEAFRAGFSPAWEPREDEFSDWHYCVIGRDEHADVFRYGARVVVLCDTDCFSATDVFLAAFKGLPGVRLVGEPSGGGSGRARSAPLSGTGLSVSLSSMASFQPDGSTYDGVGVQPDVVLLPQPTDLIGRTDSVLERAREMLLEER